MIAAKYPCSHCGAALPLRGAINLFCPACGHRPWAHLDDCDCPACVRAAVPDLLLIADDPYPEPRPELPEGGAS